MICFCFCFSLAWLYGAVKFFLFVVVFSLDIFYSCTKWRIVYISCSYKTRSPLTLAFVLFQSNEATFLHSNCFRRGKLNVHCVFMYFCTISIVTKNSVTSFTGDGWTTSLHKCICINWNIVNAHLLFEFKVFFILSCLPFWFVIQVMMMVLSLSSFTLTNFDSLSSSQYNLHCAH